MVKNVFLVLASLAASSSHAILYSGNKTAVGYQIQLKGASYCTAAALSPTCLVTAAHCLSPNLTAWKQTQTYNNSVGEAIPYPGSVVGTVNQSDFVYVNTFDSLAILQVDRPLNGVSGIVPASTKAAPGAEVTIYGNGRDENEKMHVSNANFSNTLPGIIFGSYSEVNAQGKFEEVAGGDSGAPVVLGGKLQGVVFGSGIDYGAPYSGAPYAMSIDLGGAAAALQEAKARVCTGVKPADAVSCTITSSAQKVLAGTAIPYTLQGTGPTVSAKVLDKTIVPFKGSYSGTYATSPSNAVVKLQASVRSARGSVSACKGAEVVVLAKPTCKLTATPSTVSAGQSVKLEILADGYVLNADIDSKAVTLAEYSKFKKIGSITVRPNETKTYTANVYGPNGSKSSCTATVTVGTTPPPSGCSIDVSSTTGNPPTIIQNTAATVTFNASGTFSSAKFNGTPVSTVPYSETAETSQLGSHTYYGEVTNSQGVVKTCSKSYTVVAGSSGGPSCSIIISPYEVPLNGVATLSFTATGTYAQAFLNNSPVTLAYTNRVPTNQAGGPFIYNGELRDPSGFVLASCRGEYVVKAPTASCALTITPSVVVKNGQAKLSFTSTGPAGTYSSAYLNGTRVNLPYSINVPTGTVGGPYTYDGELKDTSGTVVATCTASYRVTAPPCNKSAVYTYYSSGLYTSIPLACAAKGFTLKAFNSCAPQLDNGGTTTSPGHYISYGPTRIDGQNLVQDFYIDNPNGDNIDALNLGFMPGGITCQINVTIF